MTSDVFRISPAIVMKEIARRWLCRYWWAIAVPVAATSILSIYETRAIYVTLMVIFIVYPFVLTTVWMKYAFSQSTLTATAPQTIESDGASLIVRNLNPDDYNCITRQTKIKFGSIIRINRGSRFTTVVYGHQPDNILVIDNEAVPPDLLLSLGSIAVASDDNLNAF